LVGAVLAGYQAAPIPEAEKALFAFIEKVTREAWTIGEADVAALHRAGWSDEAIYDAVNACALFSFYNRWCDATGVHELTAEEYIQAGKRLARRGYLITADATGGPSGTPRAG